MILYRKIHHAIPLALSDFSKDMADLFVTIMCIYCPERSKMMNRSN